MRDEDARRLAEVPNSLGEHEDPELIPPAPEVDDRSVLVEDQSPIDLEEEKT